MVADFIPDVTGVGVLPEDHTVKVNIPFEIEDLMGGLMNCLPNMPSETLQTGSPLFLSVDSET